MIFRFWDYEQRQLARVVPIRVGRKIIRIFHCPLASVPAIIPARGTIYPGTDTNGPLRAERLHEWRYGQPTRGPKGEALAEVVVDFVQVEPYSTEPAEG